MKLTYPELLKLYHDFGFPKLLGYRANSVCKGILQKWNNCYRASIFLMHNTDLSELSGVGVNHIPEVRNRVVRDFIVDNTSVLEYESLGKGRAGKYTLHIETAFNGYKSIPDVYPQDTRSIPEEPPENTTNKPLVNPQNTSSKPQVDLDQTRNPNDSGDLQTLNKKERKKTEEEIFSQWVLREFQNVVPGCGWKPESENQRERFNEICKAPKEKLQAIIDKARLEGVGARGLLKWVEGGLANWEQLYNNGGKQKRKDLPMRDPRKEAIEGISGAYHFYKDGKMPTGDIVPCNDPKRVYIYLKLNLRDIEKYIDDLDFTLEQYKDVMKKWEDR